MKKIFTNRYFLFLIFLQLFSFSSYGSAEKEYDRETLAKERAKIEIQLIAQMVEAKYAPLLWKEHLMGWSLKDKVDEALNNVEHLTPFSVKGYQQILRSFFSSFQDYHAGIRFYSTEGASLPFDLVRVEGKFFVSYIEEDTECLLQVGDEIVAMDGVHPEIKVQQFLKGKRPPFSLTDLGEATGKLTSYRGDLGDCAIPRGSVLLRISPFDGSEEFEYAMNWDYISEKIPEFTNLPEKAPTLFLSQECTKSTERKQQIRYKSAEIQELRQSLRTHFVPHFWDKKRRCDSTENPFELGNKESFLPPLGKVVWRSKEGNPFEAYIFKISDSEGNEKMVGFLRIGVFTWDDDDAVKQAQGGLDLSTLIDSNWDYFASIIKTLQRKTDMLVIDQQHNPGGSLFYMYGLASMLSDYPLDAPKHRMKISQQEVDQAVKWLRLTEDVSSDDDAVEILGDTLEGYIVDLECINNIRKFAQDVLTAWVSGEHQLTAPIAIFGFDKLQPHPEARYTKPILFLVDEHCYSCADFLPAILQDSKRATIFGQQTAGAGGFVFSVTHPNLHGIKVLRLTGSLAQRNDGSFIENNGVTPDIICNLTERDVRDLSFRDYRKALLKQIRKMLFSKNTDEVEVTNKS